ncbi:outer membrane protein assembly factor BamB family protein [Halostella litorea]|uniref:outer membrane protein assembly factor BamB family protein n=1 Tax=Halostella litorea TaxID=2528831 RepID=UPI00109260F6|nr:PQQ-binding-like beta-propeller repeat protein [Halostella litorea]
MPKPMDRRRALQLVATTGAAALAGCSGGGDAADSDDRPDDSTDAATVDGTGSSTGDGTDGNSPPPGFESLWERKLPEEDASAAQYITATGDDFLAVAVENVLYGIDTADGTLNWEFSDGGDIDALAVSDTHVFLHHTARQGPGTVYAVDQANGEKAGQRQGASDRLPMLALTEYVVVPHEYQNFNDGLYVMTPDGGLYGSLTEVPGVKWVDGEGDRVVVGRWEASDNAGVVGHDLSVDVGSERRWTIPDLELFDTTVVDGTLVAPNGDAYTLLDVETGDRTDVPVETELSSHGIVSAGGLAFHMTGNEVIHAVDPAAGEVAWTTEENLDGVTSLVSTGDAVVLRHADHFRGLAPDSGEVLAQGGTSQAEPLSVAANGQGVYSCHTTVFAHDVEF